MHDARRLVLALGLLGALGADATVTRAASVAPDLHFHSLVGSRADVHYHQGLERQAQVAMALVSEILPRLEQRYSVHLPRIQIVMIDDTDAPNGFTYVFPYPMIRISVARPNGGDEFGPYESWLRLVLTHELAHAVHLDQAHGLARFGRTLLGRAPFVFPNSAAPTWLVEGLATYEETQLTSYGRGRNPDTRMVLRMAALEGRWPREDEPVLGLDRWPAGYASYLFGESFMRDLTARFGEETLPRLTNTHARWPLPFLDELTSLKVTGASFNHRWTEWRKSQALMATQTAQAVERSGLTPVTALTRRGIRQIAPRVSPDGTRIAYVSVSLDRTRQIRVMGIDGTDDRPVAEISGGTGLSWTPDGRRIVFDQIDLHDLYRWWSDLYAVDIASGRIARLTFGVRASAPDVSPDGRAAVFIRRTPSGSEIAWLDLASGRHRDLTASASGTSWSRPRIHPSGHSVVATRLSPGGAIDLALVEVASGVSEDLTHDRAKDLEPTWTRDGRSVVFRSDRDGISNLWSLEIATRVVRRVSRVLGGAFTPEVSRDGSRVIFAAYSADGYDLAWAPLQLLEWAPPYHDPYPPPLTDPAPSDVSVRSYQGWRYLWPRYWSPYLSSLSSNARLGATTSGLDPLFRHSWVATAFYSVDTRKPGGELYYGYDRFRATLAVAGSIDSDSLESGELETHKLTAQASFPITRSWRRAQALSLAWRGERQQATGPESDGTMTLSGLEAAWVLTTARQFPYVVSPIDGGRLRLSVLHEGSWLGSDLDVTKLALDGRAYLRLGRSTHTLALRAGAGTTVGEGRLTHTFAIGGFPTGSLVDLLGTSPAVLRGYEERAFTGRHLLYGNAEYRFPLFHPQRGLWTVPAFVRHLHGTLFADAGHAWTGSFEARDIKTAVGAALGIDTHLGHVLPFTGTLGIARGMNGQGITHVYVRAGLAF